MARNLVENDSAFAYESPKSVARRLRKTHGRKHGR